ncbi:TetR/AcrR family transcriptional regulator [Nocardiopsis kunsanensis]|uniref:TetR family transcriptional regulator n=1 Tax=Nocardiopsis kunsanensis TaxID=141693 RepID=A0A918X906_9ACTN|nr:TetR/AcrR family transcriptional regulator [Nocardiopsis kunsanensis]GHD18766.1 TetR family transcriptional regulator [Nocardiopsis kunsanensis]
MSQREDLLAGAKKCLVEKGYGKTTARDIAAVSGAHLASIGYHFGSKDKLMNTAVIEATSDWGDIFGNALQASRAERPSQRLRALFETLFASVPEHHDLMVAGVQAFGQAQFDEDIAAPLLEGLREARREMAALLLDLSPEEVDDATAAGLGSILYNLVTGYVLQYLVEPDGLPSPDQAVEGLHRLVQPGPA